MAPTLRPRPNRNVPQAAVPLPLPPTQSNLQAQRDSIGFALRGRGWLNRSQNGVPRANLGPRGIATPVVFKNRCYQNVVHQSLLHTPIFLRWISSHSENSTNPPHHADECMMCYYRRFVEVYWKEYGSDIVDPITIQHFGARSTTVHNAHMNQPALMAQHQNPDSFPFNQEGDAPDFYGWVLSNLQMNPPAGLSDSALQKWEQDNEHRDEWNEELRALFCVDYEETQTCQTCNGPRTTMKSDKILTLQVTSTTQDLDDMLNAWFDHFEDAPCPTCTGLHRHRVQNRILAAPQVLCFQVSVAGFFGGEQTRFLTPWDVPDNIDLRARQLVGGLPLNYSLSTSIGHGACLNPKLDPSYGGTARVVFKADIEGSEFAQKKASELAAKKTLKRKERDESNVEKTKSKKRRKKNPYAKKKKPTKLNKAIQESPQQPGQAQVDTEMEFEATDQENADGDNENHGINEGQSQNEEADRVIVESDDQIKEAGPAKEDASLEDVIFDTASDESELPSIPTSEVLRGEVIAATNTLNDEDGGADDSEREDSSRQAEDDLMPDASEINLGDETIMSIDQLPGVHEQGDVFQAPGQQGYTGHWHYEADDEENIVQQSSDSTEPPQQGGVMYEAETERGEGPFFEMLQQVEEEEGSRPRTEARPSGSAGRVEQDAQSEPSKYNGVLCELRRHSPFSPTVRPVRSFPLAELVEVPEQGESTKVHISADIPVNSYPPPAVRRPGKNRKENPKGGYRAGSASTTMKNLGGSSKAAQHGSTTSKKKQGSKKNEAPKARPENGQIGTPLKVVRIDGKALKAAPAHYIVNVSGPGGDHHISDDHHNQIPHARLGENPQRPELQGECGCERQCGYQVVFLTYTRDKLKGIQAEMMRLREE